MYVLGLAQLCPVCNAPVRFVRSLDSDRWTVVSDYPVGHTFDYGEPSRIDWQRDTPSIVEMHKRTECPRKNTA